MPKTDVLIAGSGSAGVFAATWLAIYNIPFTILEKRAGPLEVGQADGVQVRTVEIYESFGLSEDLLREAYHVLEVCFWGNDEGNDEIKRKSRTLDTEKGLSHLPHVILNQARMNGLMLAKMSTILQSKDALSTSTIEYGWTTQSVSIDPSNTSYPCTVTAEKDGKQETWHAKYVLGCDGAHSTIRRSLGIPMLGDTTDTVWGVMDIFPLTSFPDIRRKCTIHSPHGNIVIIPREGGEMVRFYIQLPAGTAPKHVQLAAIQAQARKIFTPYDMDFAHVFWWSAYAIGQRLAEAFHAHHRVFLTGDAAHTHSPKAGQGMNVSLQDGYNIGWKLGSVLSGLSPPSLLDTYISERGKTAADLIAFDRELTALFNRKEEREGEFAEYFKQSGRYMAGFTARYADSIVTQSKGVDDAAKRIKVGMRFPSAQVIRFCDCKAMQFQSALKSDGRWRIVLFAGDINNPAHKTRLEKLSTSLLALTALYTPPTAHPDTTIEPLLLLHTHFLATEQESIPEFFSPKTGKYGIKDLHKTFIDDEHYNAGHGRAYEAYGVSPDDGAMVLVRPDQYVAKMTSLADFEGVREFFAGCLVARREGVVGLM